jgi:hypothetical protein
VNVGVYVVDPDATLVEVDATLVEVDATLVEVDATLVEVDATLVEARPSATSSSRPRRVSPTDSNDATTSLR